jgi:putative membrane-bound dehydrogenase-like protein
MKRMHIAIAATVLLVPNLGIAQEAPRAADPRLVVELFAAAPDIVHPIAADFDARGRLLVIESHTHFAPKDYQGPKFDRIRMIEDTKGTGKADRFTTFFEGTRHTMDLAVHPDGSVYIATRNEILRLRDTKNSGTADEKTRIVFLDTKGDYPHNGLSGLCFDSRGNLYFGMGENLGAKYKLIGADGTTFTGEGDGGNIFWCQADGKKLRRVATGFWNPFGICRDIFGRVFAVDNDPDQMPPCRMVHVAEGGDYGFQFRYGRSGKHPFQSWHGQLPGTLPMMTGVGEAPCEILSYESDGLPAEYRGQLLVTSWADHRVERYAVKPHGASFKAEKLPFVQGGANFRPVGLATAPDGSLFVTDWVLSNYTLHGKGAIWHIRWKDAPEPVRPTDPREALFSMHRPLREAAARKLAKDPKESNFLFEHIDKGDLRVRAAALTALLDSPNEAQFAAIVESNTELGLRELAAHALTLSRDKKLSRFLDPKYPASVRIEAIRGLSPAKERGKLLELATDNDPFMRNAAIAQMARDPAAALGIDPKKLRGPKQRIAALLVLRTVLAGATKNERGKAMTVILADEFLKDTDEDVRFLAAKWVADEKLDALRKTVAKTMDEPGLSARMYMACATAMARLDGLEVNDKKLADYFAKRLADDTTPAPLRAMLLRQVPATHPRLTVDLLTKLLKSADPALKFEAVRALVEHPSPKRSDVLLNLVRNREADEALRAYAILGLADRSELIDELIGMLRDPKVLVRKEAMRALTGASLSRKQRELIKSTMPNNVPIDLVERVVNGKVTRERPAAKNLDGWLKHLDGQGDPDAGSRVFFHPKLGGCYKCHRIDGRGSDVGPDLSNIGTTDRRHLLESILQPSNNVAPHYVAWHLETADGKVRTGMLLGTHLDNYTYLDARGERFTVKTGDLVEQRPLPISIMPDGLIDGLTDQEIRDLLAYLQSRK